MTKRMLIDDTQPEETRVAVINGNKLEDVEFESTSRKQIKGNVYLAKVMRVEPSLQAAFVDYGGNRHGFLAFGEIHPDYYNVDKQTMAELEKEVETIIENKKQALKEREIERARIREEKAIRRAQRMEQEAKEKAEEKAQPQTATEGTTQAEESQPQIQEQPQVQEELTSADSTQALATAEDSTSSAENPQSETTAVAENTLEENKEQPKKTKRGRGRPAKVRRNKENKTEQENVSAEDSKIETTTSETTIENQPSEKNKEVKTLAADNDIAEEKICEEENCSDCCCEKEDCGYCPQDSGNNADDEVVADDDDDTENDFEIQKKLLLMRKLFHQSAIQDVIKEGQILLVQVVKEERGNKGAALTTYLSLAGRYCVLMPNRIKSGGVSRKITNVSDRKRLKGIIKELPLLNDMSLIVRTAGEEKTKSDIIRDYNYLIRTWEQIRFSALKSYAPCLIHEEGNLIKRALRDMFTKEISEIIIDGEEAYQTARNFMKILSPHNMKKLKADKPDDIPLFQRFQIEGQLDKLHDTNVQLESGGYLVINPTEALVSIDVNSGRATKEKDLEETALKTNLEAADEIAKQLRMRNLAGLVVIDFIDMDEAKNNLAIEKRMKEAMKQDRARVQVSKMSCFGLLEVSRQRMHSSFFESNYQSCPYCHGRGIIRTIESGAASILRTLEEEGIKNRSSKVVISLPRDTAVYLLNQKRGELVNIEQHYKMQIVICADDSVKNISDYKIERTKQTKPAEEQTKEIDNEEKTISSSKEKNKDYFDNPTPEATTQNIQENEEYENSQENSKNNYRRSNRRYRFDRRRNNRRNSENNSEENNMMTSEKNESNSQPVTTSTDTEKKTEKRKVSWWKKLING